MIPFSGARRDLAMWGMGLTLSGAFIGCTTQTLSIAESDVVVTFEDEDRDYSKIKTFSLPTRVVELCEAAMGGASGQGDEVPSCFEVGHDWDETIIEGLRSHMEALGYREVTAPAEETPDVAFFLGTIAQNNWYLTTSPGYCYDDSFWWYEPCWYPGYSYRYNLPTGTLLVEMGALDGKKKKVASAWTAVLRGLSAQSSQATEKQRVTAAIARAFQQSPYLANGGER